MIPTTRTEFKEYCLRKLGHPMIQINITDDQAEDRIDESIKYYWDYHYDGTEKFYLKHKITSDDKTNQYVELPENIIGVTNIFPISSTVMSASSLYNVEYQFVLNNVSDFTNYNLTNYYMTLQHIQFMQKILIGQKPFRFNRHTDRLYIDTNWDNIEVGTYIVAECYRALDPDVYTDMWSDRWLQKYCTAQFKLQWGSNMIKYDNIQLLGGVTFSGRELWNDANEEILRLEDEMINTYSLPVSDMLG